MLQAWVPYDCEDVNPENISMLHIFVFVVSFSAVSQPRQSTTLISFNKCLSKEGLKMLEIKENIQLTSRAGFPYSNHCLIQSEAFQSDKRFLQMIV